MDDLTATVDGQTVRLTDFFWIQSAPCGCLVSLTTTTKPTSKGAKVLATADQAHQHLVPLKRERDDDNRRGFTWALVSKATYHDEMADNWKCSAHRTEAAR